jgi:HSP20 family protein
MSHEVKTMVEDSKERELAPVRYWAPMGFGPSNLMREMERMMEQATKGIDCSMWPSALAISPRFPAVDIKDEGDHYLVEADLPGLSKEDVEVTVGEGILDITAKSEANREESDEGYIRRERGFVSFHRRLNLPDDAIEEKLEANLNDGVLKIRVQKAKEGTEKRKKVEVK